MFEEYQPAREEISQLKRQISQLKVIIGNMNDRFDGMQRGIQDRNPLEEWQVPNDQSRILRLATVSLQDLPQFGSLCVVGSLLAKTMRSRIARVILIQDLQTARSVPNTTNTPAPCRIRRQATVARTIHGRHWVVMGFKNSRVNHTNRSGQILPTSAGGRHPEISWVWPTRQFSSFVQN